MRCDLAYYSREQLLAMGFKKVGKNVSVSDKASIYNMGDISIGDNSRIDDFCIISGLVNIGRNVHITPMCLVAGGEKGITFEDFSTIAYGVQIFTQSDDYSGNTMTNSTLPDKYKSEFKHEIVIGQYSIVGAGSIIMPGANLAVGTSIGAKSLVLKRTSCWSIYVGNPAVKIKDRSKKLLKLKDQYLKSEDETNDIV